jgi:hypothetical protein
MKGYEESLTHNISLKSLFKTNTNELRLFWVFINILVYVLAAIIVKFLIKYH